MNKEELKKYIGTESLTVVEAMQKIDLNAKGILYIVDEQEHLSGSLSDGDIRRWIIKTGDLNGTVDQIMFKKTKYLFEGDKEKCFKFMENEKIASVPVVNTDLKIVNIQFKDMNFPKQKKMEDSILSRIPVVVMAGGKGTRLYPYTKILPKPLIPIGDIPILERIFNRFFAYGIQEFYLTLNYKKEMIKSYFNDLNPEYRIHYVEEDIPMGTAGSIRLIQRTFETPLIITNCDILIETDYEKIYEYHKKSGNDMTIVSSLKNMTIPYGVLRTKEHGIITSMDEKPQISHFINTGMYIINPEFLEWIPENRVFHMTDLAEKMMWNGKQVGMYPISENSFLDMGEFEEMKKMEERVNSGKNSDF